MLDKMIKDTVSRNTITVGIYRHFKGGYYVVLNLATIESTGAEVVIYQSLQDGRMWVRPSSVFCEIVPEGKENPTGQKYRFEHVSQFNNQLSMVSTDNLVKELLSRSDCPMELLISQNSDKVWREDYLVGRYDETYVTEHVTAKDFNIMNVYDSMERASQAIENHPNLSILKRVFIKQDFD